MAEEASHQLGNLGPFLVHKTEDGKYILRGEALLSILDLKAKLDSAYQMNIGIFSNPSASIPGLKQEDIDLARLVYKIFLGSFSNKKDVHFDNTRQLIVDEHYIIQVQNKEHQNKLSEYKILNGNGNPKFYIKGEQVINEINNLLDLAELVIEIESSIRIRSEIKSNHNQEYLGGGQ